MRIGIIGSGNIGGAAARLFADAGHEVALSHSGPPETLRPQVEALHGRAHAATVEEAVDFGDVVLLALPWRERASLPADRLRGKIVIDATNPYKPNRSGVFDLGDSTSSEEMARTIPGARLVKGFNTLYAKDLASAGRKDLPLTERTILFIAGDDEQAKLTVATLVAEIGFAAVDTGSLRDGGRQMQPGSPIYARPMRAADVPGAFGWEEGAGSSAQRP